MTERAGYAPIDVAPRRFGLLERAAEVEILEAAVRRARSGSGSVLIMVGTPGTGKSALLGAARQLAGDGGMRTLEAAGQESERNHPFALALQLLEPLLQDVTARDRAKLLKGPAAMAARLFSEGPASRLVDEDLASLLHGLFHLSARSAESKPTALLVDDAQFADEPSLRFLLHLGARIAGLPAIIVAVHGHGGDGGAHHLLTRLRAARTATEIRLLPLGLPAVRDWVRAESPAASAQAIHRATGGNPFLVGELLAEVKRNDIKRPGVATVGDLAPLRVREWTLRRLQRIAPGALELAEMLALLGEDADLGRAAELAALEDGQATEVADRLIEAGVLSGEQLSFTQPVVRRALLGACPPSERGEAHREAARILRRDAAPPDRVGAHLRQALPSGEEWVVEALLEAAATAGERGAPTTAVSYLRRALAEPARGEQRVQVLLQLGRAEALSGEPDAVAHLTEAMNEIADPAKRAEAGLVAGRILYLRGLRVEAARVLTDALAAAPESDQTLVLRARTALDTVARLSAETGVAARLGTAPEPAPTSVERRFLLARWAFEGGLRGSPREEVADLALRALSGSRLIELATADGVAVYLAAMALMFAEELGPAEDALSLALDDAMQRGSVLSSATAAYLRSLVRLRRGQLSQAGADARYAISLQRFGWRLGLPGAYGVLSDLELESGLPTQAATQLAEGQDALADVDHTSRAAFLARRGHWRLSTGDPPGALADFLACGAAWTAVGARSPAVYPWRSRSALALAEMDDRDGARRLVEEELALARAACAPGAEGKALHALGHVGTASDRVRLFEQAVACLERTGFSLDLCHALVDLGSALRRARRPRDAREPLRRGLHLAAGCGAVILARRAEHELGAAGAKPRRRAMTGLESLTPRERQVADLAAQGLSNREIADSLVVTTKTVEWHIRHAFEKLNVGARYELRAALEEEPRSRQPH